MLVNPKIFGVKRFVTDEKLVVVLMPIDTDWSDHVYQAMAEAVGDSGLTIWRSDEVRRDDVVMQTVWERINESGIVLADCSGRNANVFYELGIAHTVGKATILCAQKEEDFPFDVSGIRRFVYGGWRPKHLAVLKQELKEFLGSIVAEVL